MRLLDRLETGDVLVVIKLDRLGRNAIDVAQTVAKLEAMGVRVHCLTLGAQDDDGRHLCHGAVQARLAD